VEFQVYVSKMNREERIRLVGSIEGRERRGCGSGNDLAAQTDGGGSRAATMVGWRWCLGCLNKISWRLKKRSWAKWAKRSFGLATEINFELIQGFSVKKIKGLYTFKPNLN
jgi:hypothetical protein